MICRLEPRTQCELLFFFVWAYAKIIAEVISCSEIIYTFEPSTQYKKSYLQNFTEQYLSVYS